MTTLPRLFSPPAGHYFLLGPRGTGKTTWARDQYPAGLYLDLLRPDLHRSLAAYPERLAEHIGQQPGPVIVDEIQRIPDLLHVIHSLIEERDDLQFVLTGSSARKIRRQGVDLLGGRATQRTLHPFLGAEFGEAFDLERALRVGMVPLVVDATDPEESLRGYVSLYLDQEVRQEGWVRDVGSFTRFLEALSFSHAGVLNLSNIARDCEVRRSTAAGYLEVLQDLLLGFEIDVFRRRAGRATVASSKFYYFDPGVYRSIRPKGPLDRAEEIEGAALEGLVVQQVRAWNAYRGEQNGIHYWRTRWGTEVDIVVYGPDGFFGIEVKNARSIRDRDLRGLKAFADDYPEATLILLYRGQDVLRRDGILCLPCEGFLRALDPRQDSLPTSF